MIETLEIANPDKTFIKVIGVGGGGGNAVSYMYKTGVEGVDFILMNTDKAALKRSAVPKRILLGKKGLGAGSNPRIGRAAMLSVEENVRQLLSEDTEMVFVTATLGGGTGTGGAPVVARVAKELGILTIGVVTTPFSYEGPIRKAIAEEGVREMRKYVDSLVIISNDRLSSQSKDKNVLSHSMKLSSSFAASDSILATAAQCISDMVTRSGYVNVDMNDVRTVMTNSGDAVIGSSEASGEYRAMQAMREALTSPLLVNNDIRNAKSILVNYLYSDKEVTIDELSETMEMVQMKVDDDVTIIWGASQVEGMGDKLKISVVVTGQLLAEDKLVGVVPDVSVRLRDIPVAPKQEPETKKKEEEKPVVVTIGDDGTVEQVETSPKRPQFTPTETHDTTVTKRKLTPKVYGDEDVDETPAFTRTKTVVAERNAEQTSSFIVKLDGEEIKMGDNSYLSNRPD